MDVYKFLNDTKEEITKFIDIVNSETYCEGKIDESKLRFIAKKIFFLKKMFEGHENSHSDLLVYSVFQMLHNTVLDNSCIERFNLYKRIYIENLLRYLLNIDNTRNSISDMKNCLKEDSSIKEYIDALYSEHRRASGIIHVNKIEYINIDKYFLDIIGNNKKFEYESLNKNMENIIYLLSISTKILLIKKHNDVGISFYSSMEILKYLIGNKDYELYVDTLY